MAVAARFYCTIPAQGGKKESRTLLCEVPVEAVPEIGSSVGLIDTAAGVFTAKSVYRVLGVRHIIDQGSADEVPRQVAEVFLAPLAVPAAPAGRAPADGPLAEATEGRNAAGTLPQHG